MPTATPNELREAAAGLRKAAEELRNEDKAVKTASEREELDPQAVLRFLAFYTARH